MKKYLRDYFLEIGLISILIRILFFPINLGESFAFIAFLGILGFIEWFNKEKANDYTTLLQRIEELSITVQALKMNQILKRSSNETTNKQDSASSGKRFF